MVVRFPRDGGRASGTGRGCKVPRTALGQEGCDEPTAETSETHSEAQQPHPDRKDGVTTARTCHAQPQAEVRQASPMTTTLRGIRWSPQEEGS